MDSILTKFHTSIILIIFIMVICLLGLGLKEDFIINTEKYKNYKNNITKFNIDTQIKNNRQHLGWKAFWRENFSKWDNNIEKIFTNKPFSKCENLKLRYDGVHNSNPFKKY